MLRLALASLCLTLAIAGPSTARGGVTTFEDLNLPANSYLNDAGPAGQFAAGGNGFNNSYSAAYDAWSGWSLSTMTDRTTPGYANQYSSITGGGANGSATYAVGNTFGDLSGAGSTPSHPSDTFITLAAGTVAQSIQLTNTTYAYLAMRDGDPYGFAPAFRQGDYQLLDIRGYDAAGVQVGVVDFYLADYRSTNPADWSIVNTWQTVNLSSLAGAATLQFGIQSSQTDPRYGVNTPTYFAADDFVVGPAAAAVPEPSSLALGSIAGGLMLLARRRIGGIR